MGIDRKFKEIVWKSCEWCWMDMSVCMWVHLADSCKASLAQRGLTMALAHTENHISHLLDSYSASTEFIHSLDPFVKTVKFDGPNHPQNEIFHLLFFFYPAASNTFPNCAWLCSAAVHPSSLQQSHEHFFLLPRFNKAYCSKNIKIFNQIFQSLDSHFVFCLLWRRSFLPFSHHCIIFMYVVINLPWGFSAARCLLEVSPSNSCGGQKPETKQMFRTLKPLIVNHLKTMFFCTRYVYYKFPSKS